MRYLNRHLVTQLTRSHPSINPNPAEARPKPINNCEFSKNVNRRSLFNGAAQPMAKQHPQRPRRLRFSFFKTKLSKNRWKPIAQKPPTQTKRANPPSTSEFSREPPDQPKAVQPVHLIWQAPHQTQEQNQRFLGEPNQQAKAHQPVQPIWSPLPHRAREKPHPPPKQIRANRPKPAKPKSAKKENQPRAKPKPREPVTPI